MFALLMEPYATKCLYCYNGIKLWIVNFVLGNFGVSVESQLKNTAVFLFVNQFITAEAMEKSIFFWFFLCEPGDRAYICFSEEIVLA